MKLLLRLLVTAGLVLLIAKFLPGVIVTSFGTAIIVAIVLGLLNLFIKPILIILTLPVTLITLGLFLLVINAIIIMFCTNIVKGFAVDSFWTALFFSVILSILQSITYKIVGDDN